MIRHRLPGSGSSRCAFRHRSQMSGRALAAKAPGKPRHIWREPSVIPQSVEGVSGLVGQPLRAVCPGRAGRWILAMGLRVLVHFGEPTVDPLTVCRPAISEPLALAVTSRAPTRVSTALRRLSTASMRWPIRYSNARIADRAALACAPSWLAAHHRVGGRAHRRPETALNCLPARIAGWGATLGGLGAGCENAHGPAP